MPAFLVPVKPGLCVIPLEKAIVLIGRQSDCDVSLTQSRKVSRKHCCLAQVNNKIVVRDLGSTNGIFINGQRIKKEGRVKLGDVLTVGDLQFRLQTDPKPQPADNPPPRADEPRPPVATKSVEQSASATAAGPPSLDFPIILPDEGHDFAVEASLPKLPPVRTPLRNDSGPLIPLLEAQRSDSEDDVIPLGADSI